MRDESLRELSGPAGPLEAVVELPKAPPVAACVFAHPHPLHGGTMHSKPVFYAAKALAAVGVAVLRFNFRGVGRSGGVHDGGPGEMADFQAALGVMATRYPGLPLMAAGFSFGAWVAWSSALDDTRVSQLLGVGLPVDRFDFSPVQTSGRATFLIHGELDEVVPVRAIRKFYATLREPKELVVVDGAGHMFDGHASELGEAVADLMGAP